MPHSHPAGPAGVSGVESSAPRHSLIIPAHNEALLLPRLLESVVAARRRYVDGERAIQVVVADDSSSDGTADLAAGFGCHVERLDRRSIAAARNAGARASRGEILSFVDADSIIHPETFNAIERACNRPDVIAGATGIRLERWSPGIAFTYLMFLPAVLLTGMDTGVVFCRRRDFDAVGGYDERRRYGEDVAFLWALKKLGRPEGRKLVRLQGVKTTASMRKFDQHGDWHYFTRMLRLAWLMVRQPSVKDTFAERYWYGDDR